MKKMHWLIETDNASPICPRQPNSKADARADFRDQCLNLHRLSDLFGPALFSGAFASVLSIDWARYCHTDAFISAFHGVLALPKCFHRREVTEHGGSLHAAGKTKFSES